jgi:hypothetical protein
MVLSPLIVFANKIDFRIHGNAKETSPSVGGESLWHYAVPTDGSASTHTQGSLLLLPACVA